MNEPNLPLPPNPTLVAAALYGTTGPMTFGQILDRVFRLTRSHFRPFATIGMVPFGVLIALDGAFLGALALDGVFKHPAAQPNTATILWIILPLSLLFIPAMLLLYGLYYGAASYAALQADRGTSVTAGEALGHGWNKAGRYAWLLLLRGLIVSIPIFVCMLAVAGGAMLLGLARNPSANAGALFLLIPLGILLYLGAIVYAVIMSLRLSLAFPACVQEDLTASQAIKRSGVLTKGAKGRIFLVLLVIYAISYAFVMVMYAVGLFVFAIGALAGAGHLSPASPVGISLIVLACIVTIALMALWIALLMAAYSTAFAVFYRDQCMRMHGWVPMPGRINECA